MSDFRTILRAICELTTHRDVWSWGGIANKVFNDGSRSGEIGSILSGNMRYWTKAPGLFNIRFDWEKIIEDRLLPPAKDFEFLKMCRLVMGAGLGTQTLEYQDLALLVFGDDTNLSRKKIAMMIVAHRCYVEMRVGAQVRFLWDRIAMPAITPSAAPPPTTDLVTELLTALKHEYRDSVKEARRNPQIVNKLERITSKAVSGICYKGALEDREDEDPIILMEGMPVLVEWSPNILVSAILLVHDMKTMEVVLQFADPQLETACKIYPDTSRLLKGYQPFVERLRANTLALAVLEGTDPLKDGDKTALQVDDVRPGQEAIVRAGLTNSVLFIWGPPGTGKTYTLAALIAELALRGERVLATSISNRAVDELTQDLFERLRKTAEGRELLKDRRVLRLGFAGAEVLEHDELFPHRVESKIVREEIIRLKKAKDASKSIAEKAGIQQQLTALEDRLGRIVKDSLRLARIVLTTVAQVALIKEFRACDPRTKAAENNTDPFDAVVSDEASMMNATHVIPICWWGRKRVIIAGDYKQLGPVVISRSKLSLTHLHRSLFELEMRHPEHERRILPLTQQSRMHETICGLVSAPFYRGRLDTIDWKGCESPPPLMKPDRLRAGLLFVRQTETRMTKRGSRMNPQESLVVVELLKVLLGHQEAGRAAFERVGIVTPYRAQAGHLRQILKSEGLDKHKRVQVGTIHAFQGGEAEAIIWNLVDSHMLVLPDGSSDPKRKGKPGRLFADQTGERLINVAISRSKSAIYIVGDIDLFFNCSPNAAMGGILRRVRDMGHAWETSDLAKCHS